MIPKDYLERVYGGFIAMNAGIRLGAPVESEDWTYERIQNTYGDIHGYVKPYKNFAADDDVNGPVYFFRPFRDHKDGEPLSCIDFSRAWLNYAREGIGLYWWGGYGISTSNSVYLNLKAGVLPPMSGSMKQNGKTLSEQIGGQIFIDVWGLAIPCNPKKAADHAQMMASVSHDGEAINGARFITACISQAFCATSVMQIIEAGLGQIPKDSLYHKVADEVIAFHEQHPNDFRACRNMLNERWGYDKYKGACHVIPNAGICVLALLYSGGNVNRAIEVATMCGWDTDCNAGSVGTIMGVYNSIDAIDSCYRNPINDSVVLSGISGYLNILDIPTYAKEVAISGYKLAGETPPQDLVDSVRDGEVHFDFMLPGSTHNIRLSDSFNFRTKSCSDITLNGKQALEVLFNQITRGTSCRVFYKPFYTREEFNDERYSPTFAPTVYSGQRLKIKLYLEQWKGFDTVSAAPYVRIAFTNEIISAPEQKIKNNEWSELEYIIPDSKGGLIDEVGFIIQGASPGKSPDFGRIIIGELSVDGKADYTIDPAKQKSNFKCITPFSHNHGAWDVEDGKLKLMSCEYAQGYTGNYYSRDCRVTAEVIPESGKTHMLEIRAQGAMRSYAMGFDGDNTVAIYVNDYGLQKLAETSFAWNDDQSYQVCAQAKGSTLSLSIDGQQLLEVQDDRFKYGMFGASQLGMGRTSYGVFHFEDL